MRDWNPGGLAPEATLLASVFSSLFQSCSIFILKGEVNVWWTLTLKIFFPPYFRYLTASSNRNFLLTMRPFFKRAILVISYVSTYMFLKYLIRDVSFQLGSESWSRLFKRISNRFQQLDLRIKELPCDKCYKALEGMCESILVICELSDTDSVNYNILPVSFEMLMWSCLSSTNLTLSVIYRCITIHPKM